MTPRRKGLLMRIKLGILFSFLILLVLLSQIAFADEKSHLATSRELVDLTYNYQAAYEIAKKFCLLAVKDSFEKDPKTKDYSEVLINLVMEVFDAYFQDIETQNKFKMAIAKTYMEEFTEDELKEFIRFYETPIGQKALQKLPVVTQKGWERGAEIGSQISTSPKYKQMVIEKIKILQDKGKLPKESK